eukprot:6181122-Heterocapsa_arctica.AAC.1
MAVACELRLQVWPHPRLHARAPDDVEVVRDADALEQWAASHIGLAERLMEVQAERNLREPTPLPSASPRQVHSPPPVFYALPCVNGPRPLADHHRDERRRNLPRRPNCRRPEHPAESVLQVRAGDDH